MFGNTLNVEILNSNCDQKQRRKIEERENERVNLREGCEGKKMRIKIVFGCDTRYDK